MDESTVLPGLGLGLTLWQGTYEGHDDTWLRWIDANGQLVATGAERAQHAKERLLHAEQRLQRAEVRLQQTEEQADRVTKSSRQLGGKPEA